MSVPEPDGLPPPPPLVVGLVGGVGSGKSTVARLLGARGAAVLDADGWARRALEEPEVVNALTGRFGPEVVCKDGSVDRAFVSARVFGSGSDEDRGFLEGLVHPRVRERLREELQDLRSREAGRRPFCAVLDVPLLLEGPLAAWCHRIVFVDASEEGRRRRTVDGRGWSPDEVTRREAAQMDLDQKKARAHAVLPNRGTLEELAGAVDRLAEELRNQASGSSGTYGGTGAAPDPSRGG